MHVRLCAECLHALLKIFVGDLLLSDFELFNLLPFSKLNRHLGLPESKGYHRNQ